MKDFFYGTHHKRTNNSSFLDDYEEELALKNGKDFYKGMNAQAIEERLASLENKKKEIPEDDIIVHILAPKETIMGLVRKYFPQYEHGTPAFDAKVTQIVKHNNILKPNTVLIGQRIEIPITKAEREAIQAFEKYENENKSNETPISFTNLFHYVKKGDSLDNIIQRYFPYLKKGSEGYEDKMLEFLGRHSLDKPEDIFIGQQLVVIVTPKERQKADEYYQKNKIAPNPYLGNVGDMLRDDLLEEKSVNDVSKKYNFDMQALLINRMTETEVKKNLFFGKSKYKHLVSHGETGMSITGESYLPSNNESQDNHLNNQEIENMPLTGTELAFLAICYSADSDKNNSNAIAHSFIKAGVNQTIGTDWVLNSPFSAIFSEVFYQNLANLKVDVSTALRKTQLYFLEQGQPASNWAIYKHLDKKYRKKDYTLPKDGAKESDGEKKTTIDINQHELNLLQKKLNKSDAIVDIYIYHDNHYAFVITSGTFKEILLSDIENTTKHAANSNNVIKFQSNNKTDNYKKTYELLWGKIDTFLQEQNIQKIYLSTEGVYDDIKIEAIFDSKTNSYILQKYQIQRLF